MIENDTFWMSDVGHLRTWCPTTLTMSGDRGKAEFALGGVEVSV
jgi:hypothetical protein